MYVSVCLCVRADPNVSSGGFGLKTLLISLLEKIDEFELLVERHFSTTEALLAEENSQRTQLEKSLRSIAKQNYKLEKVSLARHSLGLPHSRALRACTFSFLCYTSADMFMGADVSYSGFRSPEQ